MLNEARGLKYGCCSAAYIALLVSRGIKCPRINQKAIPCQRFYRYLLGGCYWFIHRVALFQPITLKLLSEWYSIVGNGYVHLLKLVAIPLIFISILSAINKLENSAGHRKNVADDRRMHVMSGDGCRFYRITDRS